LYHSETNAPMLLFFLIVVSAECFYFQPLSRPVLLIPHATAPSDNPIDPNYWERPGVWDEKNLDSLLNANKVWAHRMVTDKPEFFEEHRKGHAPKILWIGCSDARVPANEMIGEPPGSVFVHRNIANLVVNTDVNCMSVIQYAVDVLKVKHIIVCGHYDCGGVKAALQQIDHLSPLENWLRNIRDTYRLHQDELNLISNVRTKQRRLVELNTIEQSLNIFKTAVVQRRRVETHLDSKTPGSKFKFAEPVVHAFVYEPTTGQATKLRVDYKRYLEELRDVYGLYQLPSKSTEAAGILEETVADEFALEEMDRE
jgi:carbonic anhydrase